MDILLYVSAGQPVIEDSSSIRFGAFDYNYFGLEGTAGETKHRADGGDSYALLFYSVFVQPEESKFMNTHLYLGVLCVLCVVCCNCYLEPLSPIYCCWFESLEFRMVECARFSRSCWCQTLGVLTWSKRSVFLVRGSSLSLHSFRSREHGKQTSLFLELLLMSFHFASLCVVSFLLFLLLLVFMLVFSQLVIAMFCLFCLPYRPNWVLRVLSWRILMLPDILRVRLAWAWPTYKISKSNYCKKKKRLM